MDLPKKPKIGNKSYDLDSVVTLLKNYKSPQHLQPMQNVMYSNVQMFAASWLACTQTISQQSIELHKQKRIIQELKDRLTLLETTTQPLTTTKTSQNLDENEQINSSELSQNNQLQIMKALEKINTLGDIPSFRKKYFHTHTKKKYFCILFFPRTSNFYFTK